MSMTTATWEDEENNRSIEMLVEWEGGQPVAETVTPQTVTFLDPVTKQPTRTIGVRTDAGRRLLAKLYVARGAELLQPACV